MSELPLVGKRLYLAGPIEHSSEHDWREEPKKILVEKFQINLFDPFADPKQVWVSPLNKARDEHDYETMTTIAKLFVHKDLAMVDRADLVIAYLPYKVPTTGTIHEIINSANAKKPVLLVCPQGKNLIGAWFYGFIPHKMMFGSWEDLYIYLDEVNEGKHKDNKKWHFVYGMV